MCGIAGFVDLNGLSERDIIASMANCLNKRGPDHQGLYYERIQNSVIGLGHRRLSVLDLSDEGNQPMEFKNKYIVYNGEVYNFKEIREDLKKIGYEFKSETDTEVILKAYHEWGVESVHRFNGMFTIAIYDKRNDELVLIRDRAGVKPLYWYLEDGLLLFSSELKSFHKHPDFKKTIDTDALALYLELGYVPQPHSIFENTYKLCAGHYMCINVNDLNFDIKKYWDVSDYYKLPKLELSLDEALNKTESLLTSSFNYRMVSDVPVGMFLSGGYDSSALTAIIQKNRKENIKTFTIGFENEKYNEAVHAKEIAEFLDTDHTEYYCTQKDALAILPNLPNIWDEPFADKSVIPTTLVCQLAKKDVTVALSADGGDEIFGGYNKYPSIKKKANAYGVFPKKTVKALQAISQLLKKYSAVPENYKHILKEFSELEDLNEYELLRSSNTYFYPSEIHNLLNCDFLRLKTNFDENIGSNKYDNMMAIDYKTYQADDILTKIDRASMSVSLEGREPLLDYRIIEFVARLPAKYKFHNGEKKYLLKAITRKYIPKEMMDRPKMGFGLPINEWFQDELKTYIHQYLNKETIIKGGIFNYSYVKETVDKYLSKDNASVKKVWLLIIFQMWKEKWID